MIRFIAINENHYLVDYDFSTGCPDNLEGHPDSWEQGEPDHLDIKNILLMDTLSKVELSQDDLEELENKIIKLETNT
jgi:hypothetical protein